MKHGDNLNDRIDRYLFDEMSEDERIQFEHQMANDDEIALEVETQRVIIAGLAAIDNQSKEGLTEEEGEFKKMLDTFHQDGAFEKENVIQLYRKKIILVAATLSILILSIYIIFLRGHSKIDIEEKKGTVIYISKLPVEKSIEDNLGFANKTNWKDSLVIMLIKHRKYNHHYQFRDTLKIFSQNVDYSKIILNYNPTQSQYILMVDSTSYPLKKGFDKIHPLKTKITE
ncbi:hypothetical protein QQ008_08290 [Fulvivirgaceae bacterium BMA10]|uniref:Uncharacterized protein n=1 Tax=Splendidivirga corallicola TaxID=3051826 RepID=A0ABT8KKW5_9BACT|nr:hypothetical protein [Fulvivirgaceae bacterium BMA10]